MKSLVEQSPVLGGPEVVERTGITGVEMRLAMFEINKYHRLALMEYLSPASILRYALATTNIGSIHIAIQITGIEAKQFKNQAPFIALFSRH